VGILVVWSLWAAARTRADGRHPSPAELFPLVTILCFLGLQVLYVQFADEYLLPFVPLVMSVALWPFGDVSMWMKRVTVALCLAGLALGILWTRGTLERAQAYWEAAEYLRSGGVEPRSIRAFPAMWVWNSYYGAFDEWVSEIHGSESIKIGRYHEFLGMRAGSGPYRIEETDRLGDERLLTTRCYRSYLLEKRCVNVFQRLP
jgi:hypothetical protein